jgi:hypothetical protein
MDYANGDKYDGNWKDNKKSGQGVMNFVNGNKYDGQWKDDKMNGHGTIRLNLRYINSC